MRRIVEDTMTDGKKYYRVQTRKSVLGMFHYWTTETIYDAEHDMTFIAIFGTYDEARKYCLRNDNRVVSSKIITEM